jgi:MATE family multidrug resistance protein
MSLPVAPTLPVRERHPLLEMIVIAAPVVATMTSYTLMQFVDKLMVSRIGPEPIYVGAQGNGGLASFVPIAVMMGMITVINTYVSQNLGAGRPERAPAYAWAGLWMCLAFWLVVMIPYGFVLPHIFDLLRQTPLTNDAAAESVRRDALAVGYGRILIFGSVVTMMTRAIAQYFYGMHKPVVVLVASVVGNLVNLVFNTLLVFGPSAPARTGNSLLDSWFDLSAAAARSLGIGAHGLNGSGLATVIGTTVELLIPLAVFVSPSFNRRFGTLASWRPSMPHIRELFTIGWPGALMFGNEMVCWSFFMVYLVGKFGPLHSTAGWIAHQWMSLSFMPTVGISVAITASVGKCLGMKRPDLARQRAWLGLLLAVCYMTFCGLCFVVFRRRFVGLFVLDNTPPADAAAIIALGSRFLIACAAFQFFDAIAMSLSGALRGAGDTRWTGVVTLILSWTIIVAGGLAMVRFAPGLGSLGPWIAAAAYIILLALAILFRWLSGKWRTISLLGEGKVPDITADGVITSTAISAAPASIAADPIA